MERILAVDIGNTHIKLGLWADPGWIGEWRLSTDVRRTADEYRVSIQSLLADLGTRQVDQVVLGSVVPLLTPALVRVGEVLGKRPPLEIVPPGYGMAVRYDPPEALGTDRFLNALAAYDLVGGAVVVVDAGTTATVDAVNSAGEFLGGAIAPGPHFLSEALAQGTAKLPHIPPAFPRFTIGHSTQTAIQVGVGHGFVGMVDALVGRAREALGTDAVVVLTGGWGARLRPHLSFATRLEPRLTLHGLVLAHARAALNASEQEPLQHD